ncbi:hypothetical protein RAZWK3B_08266 [Roseobacter sp. AzwK-3b]|nr:hypothetical protein RAZWK3B_08266 [Roseobacter sp. AzwK-3b]
MADAGKFSFARLNNQNYQDWKFRMEMLMIREELWYVIDEPKVEPVTPQSRMIKGLEQLLDYVLRKTN